MSERLSIVNWLKIHNIKHSEEQIDSLLGFVESVREYSKKHNLVSENDLEDLIDRHLLDSLHALNVFAFSREMRIADVGSGAGFPGIPLAIMRPDIQMYLIESRRKRSLFLTEFVNRIDLANAIVIHERWENINLFFDVILARAVFPEKQLIAKLSPRLSPGGVILYYAKFNEIKVLKIRT